MRAAHALSLLLSLAGCDQIDFERMVEQPSYRAYESSPHFKDGMAMRTPPNGAIPRSRPLGPSQVVDGRENDGWVTQIPIPVSRTTLDRGRNRFSIFCAACHGHRGDGQSQVAENMRLRKPRSLLEPQVIGYSAGQLYNVINRGYGLMPSYAEELDLQDRWAVVAYVQVLQLSQTARLDELPTELQEEAGAWLKSN